MQRYIYIFIYIIYIGLYISEDGRKVSGMQIYNGTVSGKGRVLFPNGEELIGKLKYGKLNGEGKLNKNTYRDKNRC